MPPRITVITVVYNGVNEIEATMRSVVDQTYSELEYIVIDGASSDGTVGIIKKYEQKIDFWMSEPDRGIYDAMNKGIAKASGDWINFMNCGDLFASREVLTQLNLETADADIVCGNAMMVYPTFQTLYRRTPLHQMWKRMPFCHQATFTKSSLLKKFPFNTRYKLSADFDFIFNAYCIGSKFLYLDTMVCTFDFKDGASVRNGMLSITERMSIVLERAFTVYRWIYYQGFKQYIRLSFFSKSLLGDKLTQWVTKHIKR